MQFPADLKYSRAHAWVRIQGDEALLGITDHAQKELGDIVFVETPAVGSTIAPDQRYGVVESVKSVSDLVAPTGGEVLRVNAELAAAPELVNQEPYGRGWMIAVRLADPGQVAGLLGAAEYEAFVREIAK